MGSTPSCLARLRYELMWLGVYRMNPDCRVRAMDCLSGSPGTRTGSAGSTGGSSLNVSIND